MQQHHPDVCTGGVEWHIAVGKDKVSDDEFRVIRRHGVSNVRQDGAAHGRGPVVKNRSKMIHPGPLSITRSQQLERGQ